MSRTRSALALLDLRGVRRSAWLSTTIVTASWVDRARDVVVVEPGVGVLLRVGHPHEEVDELEHPLGLGAVPDLGESKSGRSSRTRPSSDPAGHRRPVGGDVVAGADAEPVEEVAHRLVTPDRGGGGRRGGAADADLGHGTPDERVEERGLPAAGGAGEGDDRVAPDEGGALGDLRDDGARPGPLGRGRSDPPASTAAASAVAAADELLRGHDRPARGAHAERAHRTTRPQPGGDGRRAGAAWSAGGALSASAAAYRSRSAA